MWVRFFRRYSTHDLLLISLFSALGLAIKPIATPLVHLISAPLMIPGGSLAGGFYMMWLAMVVVVVPKFGSAFLIGIVQALAILVLGIMGSHGIISIISYSMPGLMVDLLALIVGRKLKIWTQILFVIVANLTGTGIVMITIMRLPFIPAMIALGTAAFSGIIGGLLSYWLIKKLNTFHLVTLKD
ncbi:MAG TPA: ECF transporter S component [Candidatus Cloacimonadota bacterium]|nr:ECF transporter S component [Candidatus Cloacimonadota bacterium]